VANKAKIVPEAQQALDLLKYEIAAEMGLPVGQSSWANANAEFGSELGEISSTARNKDYWGHITARDAGAVGGAITSRLIRKAEETLFTL
jgi:hypothetical protein